MNSIWVVTHSLMADEHNYVAAAFNDRHAAKAFEESHARFLENMEIDAGTDCYPVPINPTYSDEGFVLVEKKGDVILTRTLEHTVTHWPYLRQPGEVGHADGIDWVIVKAMTISDAKEKASVLFDQNNQNT